MASPFFINESDVIGVTRGFAIALVSRVTHWCLLIQHSLGFHRHIIGGSLRFSEIRWMQSINIFRVVVILLDVKKNSLWRFSGTLWGFFLLLLLLLSLLFCFLNNFEMTLLRDGKAGTLASEQQISYRLFSCLDLGPISIPQIQFQFSFKFIEVSSESTPLHSSTSLWEFDSTFKVYLSLPRMAY